VVSAGGSGEIPPAENSVGFMYFNGLGTHRNARGAVRWWEKAASHKPEAGSPFCSDPNCPYCMELRMKFDEMRKDNACRSSRSAE
jgi:hypothetical protein